MSLRNDVRGPASLIAVAVIAAVLTAAMAGGSWAGSTFQSSVLPVPDTPTPTDTPAPSLAATATPSPAGPEPTVTQGSASPTATQPPTPTPTVTPAPGGPGFLPPPTLTNPNDLPLGRGMLQPSGQPPLSGPALPVPEPGETSVPAAAVPSSAQLIDNGVLALSYLWLCCGAVFMLVAALALVWLARRSKAR